LSDDANSLSKSTVGKLQSTPDSAGVLPQRLVFDESASLSGISAGEYLVAGRSEKAPLGFVRKVQERRTEGGRIVLETERAPPLEAYERLVIDTTVTLTSSPPGTQSGGTTSRLNRIPDRFLDTDGPVTNAITGFCSNRGDSLCAQASFGPVIFSLKIKPEADIEIRKTEDERRININVTFGRRSVYGVQASRSLDVEIEKEERLINDKKFFAVSVGPIPVITFNLDAGFGASFEVSRTFSYLKKFKSPEGSGKGRTVGFSYEGGGARLINERRGGEATAKEVRNFPESLADLAVGDPVFENDVYGILAVDVRLAETLGPRISVEPFGRLELRDVNPPPIVWETFLGLRGEVEVNVEPFGFDVEQVDLLEAEVEDPIANGTLPESSGGNVPPYIQPPSGIEGVSIGAKRKVSWERIPGDDPADEDDVRYCVYADDEQFRADLVEGDQMVRSLREIGCVSGTELVHELSLGDEALDNPLVYRVTAAGPSGAGSEGSESITLEGEIPTVKGVTAASGDSSVTLSWKEPRGRELLEGYMIYRDKEEFSVDKPRFCSDPDVKVNCQDDRIREVVKTKKCEEEDRKYECLVQSEEFTDDEEGQVINNTKYYYRVAPVVSIGGRFENRPISRSQGDASKIVTAIPLPDPPSRPQQ
jgi:hypothetical protein